MSSETGTGLLDENPFVSAFEFYFAFTFPLILMAAVAYSVDKHWIWGKKAMIIAPIAIIIYDLIILMAYPSVVALFTPYELHLIYSLILLSTSLTHKTSIMVLKHNQGVKLARNNS